MNKVKWDKLIQLYESGGLTFSETILHIIAWFSDKENIKDFINNAPSIWRDIINDNARDRDWSNLRVFGMEITQEMSDQICFDVNKGAKNYLETINGHS